MFPTRSNGGKGGWQFAETKRSRSRRLVKLQTWVVALLREQVLKEKEARGDALVFRAQRGGPIRESRFVQEHFKPLLKSAELPAIRLYDLRHTCATISLIADKWAQISGRATRSRALGGAALRLVTTEKGKPPAFLLPPKSEEG